MKADLSDKFRCQLHHNLAYIYVPIDVKVFSMSDALLSMNPAHRLKSLSLKEALGLSSTIR